MRTSKCFKLCIAVDVACMYTSLNMFLSSFKSQSVNLVHTIRYSDFFMNMSTA